MSFISNDGKRRVLFFVPLPPPIHGAALRNKSLVESTVIKNAFNIKVIPFAFASENSNVGKASFIKFYKMVNRMIAIIKCLIVFKPNLVYFNLSLYGFALYRDALFVTIFKLFRRRLVFHLRTQGIEIQIEKSLLKKYLFLYLFNNVRVICLSTRLSSDIRNVYFKEPIIVNNGLEDLVPASFTPQLRMGSQDLLFLSNLSKAKGIVDFIDALTHLNKKGKLGNVWIAGADSELTAVEVRSLIEERQLKGVHVVGAQYGDEKINLFSKSSIFVLPTHFEAFPGVIIEAMQFGLAVVASDEGAIPEIVDDGRTGFIFTKGNILELTEKIEYLLEHKDECAAMGLQGRAKYLNKYTLDIFENNMLHVLKKTVG